MLTLRSATALAMIMASAAMAHAEEFPTAPPKLKDAEAQGLVRMSTEELKSLLQGKTNEKGTRGSREKTFHPDGSVDRTGFGQKEGTGKWRFDDANNVYCLAFQEKKGYQENCYATFRAPDSTHYFDYDNDTGFFQRVWRRVTAE